MSENTSSMSSKHEGDLLVGVAESIGSTLGTMAAKARAVKKALTASKAARRRLRKRAGRAKKLGSHLAKKTVRAGNRAKKVVRRIKKS